MAQELPPQFVLLPETATGIAFANQLTENEVYNVLAYEYFYNGGGVALGDINNDGLCDVYLVSNQRPNRLYLNKGNFSFKDITVQSGTMGRPGWKTGVTMVDINADGWLDIYVCYSGRLPGAQRANELFINNGDLTFTEQASAWNLADTSYTTHATFFDYDRDGDLDCYLLNHNIKTYRNFEVNAMRNTPDAAAGDKLLRNDGGRFTDVSRSAGIYQSAIGFGLGVVVTDFNGDDWPDLYVANDYTEYDYFYINQQNGTFRELLKETMGHCSHFSMGADGADINNDGFVDLVTLDMFPADNYRQKILRGPNNYEKYRLQVAFGFHHQVMRNCLQLNNGNGTFSEIGQLAGIAATDWSWAPLLADFDNDGWKDLFVTNGYRRDYTNMDFLRFAFEEEKERAMREGREPDLVWLIQQMPSVKLSNFMFRNRANLTFEDVTQAWHLHQPSFSNGAAYADLDNDGDLDLVVNHIDAVAGVYRNMTRERGGGNFLSIRLIGPAQNPFGIGAKITVHSPKGPQFAECYMSRGFQSSVPPIVHFGLGTDTLIEKLVIVWPDGRFQEVEQLPVNRLISLSWNQAVQRPVRSRQQEKKLFFQPATPPVAFHHRENDYVDFKQEPLMPHMLSRLGPAIAIGDVDGNGLDDLFLGAAAGFPSRLFLQQRNHRWVELSAPWLRADSAYEDVAAVFFDADGDHDPDLYVCSGGYEFAIDDTLLQDRLYMNKGKGQFERQHDALPVMLTSTAAVAPADIDGDGDLDLFVGGRLVPTRYGHKPRSYLLENRGGTFHDVTEKWAPPLVQPGMVTDAVWANLNADDLPDLTLCGEWMPIRVFQNTGNQLVERTQQLQLDSTHGWWNRLLIADIDHDGDVDIIAGNRGENSLMQASPQRPVKLYLSDFDLNGSSDPVICYFIGDSSYPMPSRDELIDQINILRKKYVYSKDYATQQIDDIFSVDQLAKADVLYAYVFSSVVLINDGAEGYSLHRLPVEAQFSRVQGLLFEDLDSDGHKDLVVAGNYYPVRAEMGRDDASWGVFLRGPFPFTPVTSLRSGLLLGGDVRNLRLLHGTGSRRWIVAARNDDTLLWLQVAK